MSLQWSENAEETFKEAFRILKPGGKMLYTTLGPKTLMELRESWSCVNQFVHVNKFLSFCENVQTFENANLTLVSYEKELRQLEYDTVWALMRDLKSIGAHNVNSHQNSGLTTRRQIDALANAYEKHRNAKNLLPASYDIFYFVLEKPW